MRLFRCAFDECHLMSVQLPSDFVALRHIGAQQEFLCRPALPNAVFSSWQLDVGQACVYLACCNPSLSIPLPLC